MPVLSRFFSILFITWGLCVFTSSMLLMLPFIMLSTLVKGRLGGVITFFLLRVWAWIVMLLCLYPVIVRNRAKLAGGHSFIYVSNHNSYLDSPAMVIAAPTAFKPLGKIEMTKIPVFGIIYKKVVVLIDRSSRESRSASVMQLKKELDRGMSVLLFPEGTMNKGLKPLTEFYDGAFRIAIETQTPIAPFVIINARRLMPRSHPLKTRPGIVTCIFTDPFPTAGLTAEDMPALKERVYRSMEQLIMQHEAEVMRGEG